ncbi:MAG: hypothetical protein ACYC9L_05520 [Sulfuricaulis sp.]
MFIYICVLAAIVLPLAWIILWNRIDKRFFSDGRRDTSQFFD